RPAAAGCAGPPHPRRSAPGLNPGRPPCEGAPGNPGPRAGRTRTPAAATPRRRAHARGRSSAGLPRAACTARPAAMRATRGRRGPGRPPRSARPRRMTPVHRPRERSGGLGPLRALLLEKLPDPRRKLRALRDPVLDPSRVEFQLLLATPGDGIEVTHALDVAPVALVAGIGDHDVVKGSTAGPGA